MKIVPLNHNWEGVFNIFGEKIKFSKKTLTLKLPNLKFQNSKFLGWQNFFFLKFGGTSNGS